MPSQNENDEFKEIFDQFKDANENDDKEAATEAVSRLFEQLGKKNQSSPFLEAMKMAHDYEALYEWGKAERCYRHAFDVSHLRHEDPSQPPTRQVKALVSLWDLLNMLGEKDRALQTATEAVALARTIEDPVFLRHSLLDALRCERISRLQHGDLEIARTILAEEITVSVGESQQEMPAPLSPRSLIARAALNIKTGDLKAAHADLEKIWPALEAKREWTIFVAYQGSLAYWWETKAALCAAQNDTDGEIEALRQALHYRKVISQAPQLEGPYKFNNLAHAWFMLAKALRAANSPEANQAFKQSAQIRHAIGLPSLE